MASHVRPNTDEYPEGVDRRWHMESQFGYLLKDPRETPFISWVGSQAATTAPENLLRLLGRFEPAVTIDPLS